MQDQSGSLFQIGGNVELWRVLWYLSLLVVFVIVLEQFLHITSHRLRKYPKYHEMMTKVIGELMILGIVGLLIKIVKEQYHMDSYSKTMIGFQAADLTMFILAIALILQAICVYIQLRKRNKQIDKAELISSEDLEKLMTNPRREQSRFEHFCAAFHYCAERQRKKTKQAILESEYKVVADLRILRFFFLHMHQLPQLFPFAKYLRQAQENQASHMIEVEMSTWMILLLCAWTLQLVANMIQTTLKITPSLSLVVVFVAFTWLAVVLHFAIHLYFQWAIRELLAIALQPDILDASISSIHTIHHTSHPRDYLSCLRMMAKDELDQQELAVDAMTTMKRVRDDVQKNTIKRKRSHFTAHDKGFQLISTLWRYCVSNKNVESRNRTKSTTRVKIYLPYFSRKAWHFVVVSTLMLNGLYFALFFQCILHQMARLCQEYGPEIGFLLPLPLVINMMWLQPEILGNFILISCVLRLDETALSEVIDHFTETVELRTELITSVKEYLLQNGLTVTDIEQACLARDTQKTGLLDLDEMRIVLDQYGFKLSFFKFNSIAKILFQLNGLDIPYAQVLRLLEIGEESQRTNESVVMMGQDGLIRSMDRVETPDMIRNLRSEHSFLRSNSGVVRNLYQLEFTMNGKKEGKQSKSTPENYILM